MLHGHLFAQDPKQADMEGEGTAQLLALARDLQAAAAGVSDDERGDEWHQVSYLKYGVWRVLSWCKWLKVLTLQRGSRTCR